MSESRITHSVVRVPRATNRISAKVAYWNRDLKCLFANDGYRDWYGQAERKLTGINKRDLLGAAYDELVASSVRAVLAGEKRVLARTLALPDGTVREGIVTYTPDVVGGEVCGFFSHVADVAQLQHRDELLAETIREVIQTLEKTKASFRSKELGLLRQKLEQVLNPPKK